MRHGKMGRHVDTAGHGHGNLLELVLLLVACCLGGRGSSSVRAVRLESLQALVVCFIASFTVPLEGYISVALHDRVVRARAL